MLIFELNCLLLNEDKIKVFTVKISDSENVSILKELIKAKKARHLAHLDASDLILWKVRLPPDQSQYSLRRCIYSWRHQYFCPIDPLLRSTTKFKPSSPIYRSMRMNEMTTFNPLMQLKMCPHAGRIVQSVYTF
jgi:hypothetical protein